MFDFTDILVKVVAPFFFLGAVLPMGGWGLSTLVNFVKLSVRYV